MTQGELHYSKLAKTIGRLVKKVREHRGLSHSDLCGILVQSSGSVSSKENGKSIFTLIDLDMICKEFGDITPNHLMGYEPLPKKYQK